MKATDFANRLELDVRYIFYTKAYNPWEDRKFWVGIGLWVSVWAYWHFAPTDRRYEIVGIWHWTALLVFGQNLAVLSMLQTWEEVGVIGLVLLCCANTRLTRSLFGKQKRLTDSFEAESLYENLDTPIAQLVTIFTGQTILLVFLVWSSYVKYPKKPSEEDAQITYSFWIAAYVAVQMSGFFKRGADSQVGKSWDVEKWNAIRGKSPHVEFKTEKSGGWFRRSYAELYLRDSLGFFVNTFYRDIVMFITPLLCMQSEDAVEFVQNCFALSYITTIDDMGDAKTIEMKEVNSELQDSLLQD